MANLICLDTIAIQPTHSMHANSQPDTRTPSNSRAAFPLMTQKRKIRRKIKLKPIFCMLPYCIMQAALINALFIESHICDKSFLSYEVLDKLIHLLMSLMIITKVGSD